MSKTERQKLGKLGEDVALDFLIKRGFRLRERNYLKKWGEIDLVMEKEGRIHFVEVKSVTRDLGRLPSPNDYQAEENVHQLKLQRMKRTLETYLLENKMEDKEFQIDVVAVMIDSKSRKAKVRFTQGV